MPEVLLLIASDGVLFSSNALPKSKLTTACSVSRPHLIVT